MSILDSTRDSVQKALRQTIGWALGLTDDPYEKEYAKRAMWQAYLVDYYSGVQKKSLKTGKDGVDFNVTINLAALIIDRTVSMLFGGGIEFETKDETKKEFLESVWDANKKDILLHDLAQNGGISGTAYAKILPNDLLDRSDNNTFGIIALTPINMIIGVNPRDVREVLYYVNRWNVIESGKNVAYREVTKKIPATEQADARWEIYTQAQGRSMSSKWEQVGDVITWDYEFPPIVHTKNLPNAGGQYGRSDIEDVLGLQDDYNQAFSNVNKILWFHGHPHLWTNGAVGEMVDWSTEKILKLKSDGMTKDATLQALELSGDLGASREFYNDIRRDLMDVSRTTDVETIKDKAGTMTNFGLRVLFKDELAKTKTKQLLYGEFIGEINRRLLLLNNMDGDAGTIQWGESLPENENEETTALKSDLEMGIVSRETVSMRRGYDWAVEKERLAGEKRAEGNVGGRIITDFFRGGGNTGQDTETKVK